MSQNWSEDLITEIILPDGVNGKLYRAPVPGREDWPLRRAIDHIFERDIDVVVMLLTRREIIRHAGAYRAFLEAEDYEWDLWELPIEDGRTPEDEEEFIDLVYDVAEELRGGINVLAHCYAGVGRTGLLVVAVLVVLGLSLEDARRRASDAGCGPETAVQERFVNRIAGRLKNNDT